MKNKNLYLLSSLLLSVFAGITGSFASGVNLQVDFGTAGVIIRPEFISRNIVPIHFKDGGGNDGNDFGGFIYFANGVTNTDDDDESNVQYKINLNNSGTGYECFQKVRGFYYNAERGERLWPLDDSYMLNDVEMTGGLYTRCREEGFTAALESCSNKNNSTESALESCEDEVRDRFVDAHGYYGIITHTYDNQDFVLVAGTNYEDDGSTFISVKDEFAGTLIRFDNKFPVGFLYDINGGAGFVGCQITGSSNPSAKTVLSLFTTNGNNWQNVFRLNDEGTGIELQSTFTRILDCSNRGSAKNSLISVIVDGLVGLNINPESENFGIEGNQGNQKMQFFGVVDINNMQLINYAKQKAEVLCRGKWKSYVEGSDINCVLSNADTPIEAPTNKTLIVKGGADVIVNPMSSFEYSGYYDVFVDGGNLLIRDGTVTDLTVFKKNGFISDNDLSTFEDNVYTGAWNSNLSYSGDDVVAGKFIKGNFIVNGNIDTDNGNGLNNVYFIYGKMTTKDTVNDLKEVFKWKCNNGSGSDSTPCPLSWSRAGESWDNPYENASLVIIDQTYPSKLYD